jgi:hypothetical protein
LPDRTGGKPCLRAEVSITSSKWARCRATVVARMLRSRPPRDSECAEADDGNDFSRGAAGFARGVVRCDGEVVRRAVRQSCDRVRALKSGVDLMCVVAALGPVPENVAGSRGVRGRVPGDGYVSGGDVVRYAESDQKAKPSCFSKMHRGVGWQW